MNWKTVFQMPTQQQILSYQQKSKHRSPYIAAYMNIPADMRYREYIVDFRVLHLPRGTYCCLGCWGMDYANVKPICNPNDWAAAYAGFQKIGDDRTTSIMSVWDRMFQFSPDKKALISAKRLYPEQVINGGRFWGEGEGERSSAPFFWEEDHWYRMHLRVIDAQNTTILEQGVWDLETMTYTLLCRYDLKLPKVTFKGTMCAFLENFLTETSGEVRSMQLRNARYLPVGSTLWQTVRQAQVCSAGGLPAYEGSYDFGSDGEGLWMITSGVGGDWYYNGKGRQMTTLPVPSAVD